MSAVGLAEIGEPQVLPDPPARAQSGYLIVPGTRAAQELGLALLRERFVVNVATLPLRADGKSYPAGTLVLRTGRNPATVHDRIARLGARLQGVGDRSAVGLPRFGVGRTRQ